MKHLVVLLGLFACSAKREDAPPPSPSAPPPVSQAPRQARNSADPLLERQPCEAPGGTVDWTGSWVGSRPFDDSNPFLHRGPTRVTIEKVGDKLHYKEGVGAAAIEVDLEIHPSTPNEARGAMRSTDTKRAINLGDDGARPQTLTITVAREIAACIDAKGLHVARVLGAHGEGIAPQDESDVAVLEREPPPPPAPPPPKGFEVLADGQRPHALALGADDVVWTHGNGDVPVTHSIRAVAKTGGPVRELASKLSNVRSLQVHGEHVYFAEQGGFRIGRVPLAGGEVETVVADTGAIDLAITRDTIVWSDLDDAVRARAVSGGAIRTLVAPVNDVSIRALATDGNVVYAATSPFDTQKTGKVMRVLPSTATVATDTVCGALVVARGEPWWASCDGELHRGGRIVVRDMMDIEGVALTKTDALFVLGAGRGEVLAVPIAGGKPRQLVAGDFFPEAVLVDGSFAYVNDLGFASNGPPQGRVGRIKL